MNAPVEEKHRKAAAYAIGIDGGVVREWIKDGNEEHMAECFNERRIIEARCVARGLAEMDDAATMAERRRIVALVLQVKHEIERDRPASPLAWMESLQQRILDELTTHESFADEAGKLVGS